MSIILPEIEIIEASNQSVRYLEHGWPSDLCRWHAHEEYEIHLILATRGKAFVGDYIGAFGPGCLYFVGPNLPHNWVTDENYSEPVAERDMVIQFNPQCLANLCAGFSEFRELNTLLEQAASGLEFFNFDVQLARPYFEDARDLSGIDQVLSLLKFLNVLKGHQDRTTLSVMKLNQIESSNKKYANIGEVVDLIVENCAAELSVSKAASMAGMSEASFARNFQAVTGNRFTEFVNRVRIGKACVLLFETEEQISSICFDVGFQNLANFNRHFLTMKGVTPSEYRNAARAGLSPQAATNTGMSTPVRVQ